MRAASIKLTIESVRRSNSASNRDLRRMGVLFAIDHAAFNPLPAFLGGILIGAAAGALALMGGKVMGCSGIAGGNLHDLMTGAPVQGWRLSFLLGVLLGPVGWIALRGPIPGSTHPVSLLAATFGGLAVGFGTRLGSGCTSGHGVCGLPRLSKRSFVAVGLFIATAMITVGVTHHLS